jgi:hypothetical protein
VTKSTRTNRLPVPIELDEGNALKFLKTLSEIPPQGCTCRNTSTKTGFLSFVGEKKSEKVGRFFCKSDEFYWTFDNRLKTIDFRRFPEKISWIFWLQSSSVVTPSGPLSG